MSLSDPGYRRSAERMVAQAARQSAGNRFWLGRRNL